ncbi:uncharacterized protein PRCAT00003314001 [Priceomyces carsonii]|uniref:uncharacterized protein n=1 Tax=Priceomyces carsonii TaxID=28549 RepID=UPI002EDAC289|nr:unnamed protein product [Priceomyces carsonii]
MTDSEYSFATSILTNKNPEQAALIIPNCLTSSTNLIEKSLLVWFNEYTNRLQKHTRELQTLLDQGSGFFKSDQLHEEFGSFSKTFNCLLTSLETEIHANEQAFKSIKLDIIGPLKNLTEKDVRYSELIMNSHELQEIERNITSGHNNAEYQWNLRAPQTFENFENFKKFEKQLLFDVILNFFNNQSQNLSKQLQNNENSVNYLLGCFKIDDEMKDYLNFLLKSEFKPVHNNFGLPTSSHASAGTFNHKKTSAPHDSTSLASSSHSGHSKHKMPSKLRSKVGSIFGRKSKKSSKAKGLAGISETDSLTSSTQRSTENLSKSRTRDSLLSRGTRTSTDMVSKQDLSSRQAKPNLMLKPPQTPRSQHPAQQYSKLNVAPSLALPPSQGVESEDVNQSNFRQLVSQNELPSLSSAPLTPRQPELGANGSPNVVKYKDLSSSSSSSVSSASSRSGQGNTNRMSMLQKHDLAPGNPSDPQLLNSRHSSAGKYSFETGDDEAPISTNTPDTFARSGYASSTPAVKDLTAELPQTVLKSAIDGSASGLGTTTTSAATAATASAFGPSSKGRNDSFSRDLNGHNIGSDVTPYLQSQSTFSDQNRYATKTEAPPPPPPPSRRVIHRESQLSNDESKSTAGRNRKDINSRIFHDLPAARDSIVAPANELVSQDTGNSLARKGDGFKHFDTTHYVEQNGLNASIAEVINVSFKDGKLVKSQVVGEIAFNYKSSEEGLGSLKPVVLKVPNKFEKVILNHSFVEQVNDTETYTIDPVAIISKTLGGIRYLETLNDSQVPLLVQQIWKYEDHQSSLMISLRLNPLFGTSLQLNDFVVSVALDASAEATSASSKPQGSFSKEKNRITWRYENPLILSSSNPEEKLIARFMTEGRGREHSNGVQLRFHVANPPNSLKILDLDDNLEVPADRSLVSGNYSSHS